jgi:hypothetical protein
VEPAELVVERSAPVAPPRADAAAWLADQHVFISSVIQGMGDERAAVAKAIESAGAHAVWFERFGGRDDDPEAAYLAEVDRCSIYVGLLGERYGKPLPSGYSATHAEYDEAQERGLRMSMWVSSTEHDGRQTDFINEVAAFHTYGSYADAAILSDGVTRRLMDLAAEDLSPWAKLGSVVFRAARVRATGTRIVVEVTTRDNEVSAGLLRLQDRGLRPVEPLHFTHDLTSTLVELVDVAIETTAGNTRRLEITLTPKVQLGGAVFADLAIEGRSPEDLTELGLRVALFGEENPLGRMGFTTNLPNPFDEIAGQRLSEEVVGPVIRVLLTEILVSSGRAERITSFRMGPMHKGRRRLAMSWIPRQRYANVMPKERQIEGEISL